MVVIPGARCTPNVAVFSLARVQAGLPGQVFPRDKLLAKLQPYRSAYFPGRVVVATQARRSGTKDDATRSCSITSQLCPYRITIKRRSSPYFIWPMRHLATQAS